MELGGRRSLGRKECGGGALKGRSWGRRSCVGRRNERLRLEESQAVDILSLDLNYGVIFFRTRNQGKRIGTERTNGG